MRSRTLVLPAPVVAGLLFLGLLGGAVPARAQGGVPQISAPSAIVVEATTGDVAFARAASERRPIASATKLMTALITLETVALDDVLTAPPYAASPAESLIGLRAGERMSVRDLLRALMLPSANDAAVTLATGISGSVPAFVREMNARARALGLRDTQFTNPIGLDEGDNRSSARDLVRLTRILRRHPFFRRTTDLRRVTLKSGGRRRTVTNRNRLVLQVPEVDGVKTGHTSQAGYVLVGSATRNGVTVVSAVLGAADEAARDADSLALLRYALGRYRRATLVRTGRTLARAALEYRDDRVPLVAGRPMHRVLRRGERAQIRVVGAPERLDGPLPAGARVGTVQARVDGRVVGRVPLVTSAAVEEADLGTRLGSLASQPGTLLLLAVLATCTVFLVLLRRRVVRKVGGRG